MLTSHLRPPCSDFNQPTANFPTAELSGTSTNLLHLLLKQRLPGVRLDGQLGSRQGLEQPTEFRQWDPGVGHRGEARGRRFGGNEPDGQQRDGEQQAGHQSETPAQAKMGLVVHGLQADRLAERSGQLLAPSGQIRAWRRPAASVQRARKCPVCGGSLTPSLHSRPSRPPECDWISGQPQVACGLGR